MASVSTRPTTPADNAGELTAEPRTPAQKRVGNWLGRNWSAVYAILVLAYLFLPVAVVMLFGFNDNAGRFNFVWQGFTLDNYANLCVPPGLCEAMVLSLRVALLSTLAATILGTLIAFALVRHRFRGRSGTNLLIIMPMATPEVVMGSSLLALFLNLGVGRGTLTVVIGHILFIVSYVVVTVKARLQGQDASLEEAAADLYADEWTAFRKVTLPLMMPGIVSGALLAFALSFDDFIVTNFVSGNAVTFPMYVWGAAQRGVPPQVNALATVLFLVTVVAVLLAVAVQRKR
jgi:spermidine/putrescine transport system permease protein